MTDEDGGPGERIGLEGGTPDALLSAVTEPGAKRLGWSRATEQ